MSKEKEPKPRGFAKLTPEQRSELARRGGKMAQALGRAHRFSSEEARNAGRLGALARAKKGADDGDVR